MYLEQVSGHNKAKKQALETLNLCKAYNLPTTY